MRLWTVLVRLHGWLCLRRVFLPTFVLVMVALPYEASTRAVEAQPAQPQLRVWFDPTTPPIALEGGKPVLCQGQQYRILVLPQDYDPRIFAGTYNNYAAEVVAALNPMDTRKIGEVIGRPILFFYTARERGEETLEFKAY